MPVQFTEREGTYIALMSGDYVSRGDYFSIFQQISKQLQDKPRGTRILLDLGGISEIDEEGLSRLLERLCNNIVDHLGGNIKLCNPPQAVSAALEGREFEIPIYRTIDEALKSFEDHGFNDKDLFMNTDGS